jgi:spermidine/putrescine transport system permease protein
MKNKLYHAATPYVIWMALFVVAPIIMVVIYAFTSAEGGFTFANFLNMGTYTVMFTRSFKLAAIATIICLLIGYPVSYMMSKEGPQFQKVAMILIMLPMWMNFLLRTYSWMSILENNGLLNNFLQNIGLINLYNQFGMRFIEDFTPIAYFQMLNTQGAVILGMVYNYLPFMVLPIHTVISKLDKNVIEASQDLGCNRFEVITKVILPLSKSGIVSGITMVFVPAISTFYVSKKLGGTDNRLIGEVIEDSFFYSENWNFGSAISFVLMIIIMISIAVVNKFSDDEEDGGMIL